MALNAWQPEAKTEGETDCLNKVLAELWQLCIQAFNQRFAIFSFQLPDDKVPSGHVLEVVHKYRVNYRPARRADGGYGLSGGLLGDLNAKALGNFRDQFNQDGRPFIG